MNRILLAIGLALLAHGAAQAQASPCGGARPAVGEQVRGPVLHVVDGRTLCVATAADPSAWVRLELEAAPATATWPDLMSVAFGKDVVCTMGAAGATCRAEGRSLAAELRAPGVEAASTAWRPSRAQEPVTPASLRVAAAS